MESFSSRGQDKRLKEAVGKLANLPIQDTKDNLNIASAETGKFYESRMG